MEEALARHDRFGEDFSKVFTIINSAEIPAVENSALYLFVGTSRAPDEASKYVRDRVAQNAQSSTLEETLHSIHEELKILSKKMTREDPMNLDPEIEAALYERDGGCCFITGRTAGVQPIYIIPPSILEDKDLQPGGYLRPLLEVSLTKEGTEQMLNLLGLPGRENVLKNLILMEPSIRYSFRHGYFEIIKSPYLEPPYLPTDAPKSKNGGWWLQPIAPQSEVPQIIPRNNELYKVPSTINPISHPLPARLLLKTHGIVSHPLHTIYIEEQIKAGWPVEPEPKELNWVGRLLLQILLRLIPNFARIRLYELIYKMVDYWDPSQKGSHVKFLPLGLVLKKGRENTENEAKALTLAEQYISISTPRLIDSVMVNKTSGFILMTKVVGRSLSSILHRITWEELEQIGKDLANFITELRRIPNSSKYLIADTRGGPISDHRFFYQTWGPFKTVSGFTDRLLQDVKGARDKPPLSFLYEKKHKVYFTHSDIHMTNLFVTCGRLSGVVDWENAGFKPEYWEYIRAMWAYGADKHAKCLYGSAFGDKYKEEGGIEITAVWIGFSLTTFSGFSGLIFEQLIRLRNEYLPLAQGKISPDVNPGHLCSTAKTSYTSAFARWEAVPARPMPTSQSGPITAKDAFKG
ncbi:hypothetical protein TRV_07411 [Trichophyton verrucosum HKI 0517]|uniref:Aminoglycoside phosphotransferase domain-containing protein n=1 Tax=Trichophyton verrucosum (strain HKI 0517) TaxID=663202 RepID=D4DJP3_TRIVH|nr:uncharacterized protein TRV_07411 [Trichophyton verrucosum HKI 0517]EFE37921.1 hypothetical protein TRV_07411 [Trichophyton verrucosum HKI 0517]